MAELTMDTLKEIMLLCSGVDEAVSLDGDIEACQFRELGYDSLAVLEIASQVQRRYGLSIPDEAIEQMTTPGSVLSYVRMAQASV
jgi:act minimal PKS acyl carrier protein